MNQILSFLDKISGFPMKCPLPLASRLMDTTIEKGAARRVEEAGGVLVKETAPK
jgi:hypothetical protein